MPLEHDVTFSYQKDIDKALNNFYSKTQINKLVKQNGIKIATVPPNIETWIKIGKHYLILTDSKIAHEARVFWEYHNHFKPKELNWKLYEE
jgi:cytochrome c-type biogenesis protein CcmH/NrfG